MTLSARDRPRRPQAPPTRGAASLMTGAPRRARGPPMDCRHDQPTTASGLDRPPPSTHNTAARSERRPLDHDHRNR